MDSQKLRQMIRKYLSEKPRNTIEISAWIESQAEIKEEPSDLTGLLESDDSIVMIGTVRKSGVRSNDALISEWANLTWVEHHERGRAEKQER